MSCPKKETDLPIVDISDVVAFESKDVNEKHVHSAVFVGKVPAAPMRISAEGRAEGIPEWDGPDYQFSLVTKLFFDDGSEFDDTHLDFSPGTHGWERRERHVRARLGVTKIQVDYFFEHKAGKVAYRNFRIEEAPPRPTPDRRVVLLGASNTITSYLAPEVRVDALLAGMLRAAFPKLKIDVENAGVGGDTVKRFLETKRYERDLLTLDRIDVIFITFGGNDSSRYDVETFTGLHRELIARLRSDFPHAKIVLQTGTWVDYPKHYSRDMNAQFAPYFDALRGLSSEADGVLDVCELMKREAERGNWDMRYRNNPVGKLILDDRFDAGHEDDPTWFSNIHHTPNATRLIARWTADHILENKLLSDDRT